MDISPINISASSQSMTDSVITTSGMCMHVYDSHTTVVSTFEGGYIIGTHYY